ncbi:hypothetical protein Mal15_03220 [Stieleria maiorica]|uniref:Arrestin-like N-terminal domain-containing protein n=1 Tax=Stieleria maiorica TaxID=2795974 RepID=A0A5B9M9T6_9BACT|nr:sporulation protein [Stieleria maiorica]QEF96295.1 hypothetical protein Mal15_03220 [Stieleria maiorica]
MAKCDLSIELDHPDRVYVGEDKITGTLHVLADADVNCKGLEISSGWRTHGRGNVARGTTETVTLFAGQWSAGQRESYRFELEVAAWPPSYHGNYINVDHYIDARAKIPWAFDPKASAEFVMRPIAGPDHSDSPTATAVGGCIGYGLVILVLGLMAIGLGFLVVTFVVNPFAGLIAAGILIPLVGLIAAKKLLPKWLLGNVHVELITPQVAPGGRVRARLAFQPKRRFTINSISAELTGTEVCISGSGSNRTTHRNTFFTDRHELEGAATLQAGDRKEFQLDFPIPGDVPYSFDLSDNDLVWTIELRVDIPRWPDWTHSLKLLVAPDGRSAEAVEPAEKHLALDAAHAVPPAPSPSVDDITFAETATHLWNSRNDDAQLHRLVEAVTGMTFEIDTLIERRLLYSGEEDPHVYKDGYAVWARHTDPPLPLVLYIPHELADEFEQAGHDQWRCRGTIVGWDHPHRRLQIKVLVR